MEQNYCGPEKTYQSIEEDEYDMFGDSEEENTEFNSTADSEYEYLMNIHKTSGLREGIEEGKELSLQIGFNEGFSQGSKNGFSWGVILGVLGSMETFYSNNLENLGNTEFTLEDIEVLKNQISIVANQKPAVTFYQQFNEITPLTIDLIKDPNKFIRALKQRIVEH